MIRSLAAVRMRKRAAFAAAVVVAFCGPYLLLTADWTLPRAAFAAAFKRSVYVIDGDTLDINGERIRLRSETGPIDAPELRSAKCRLELFRAEASRDRLRALMAPNDFSIDRRGKDRYGRTVAIVYSEGRDVGGLLVREGHARPWPRLTRADRPTWC